MGGFRRQIGRAGVAIAVGGAALLSPPTCGRVRAAGDAVAAAGVRTPAEAVGLAADAGEDEIGVVGRRVRLDGAKSRSGGAEAPGYRWVQVAGPEVRDGREEGSGLSFVPAQVGVYRFALVVASGSAISAPDVVEVQVGTWTAPPGTGSATATAGGEPSLVRAEAVAPAPAQTSAAVPTLAAVPIEAVARVAIRGVAGGPERGGALAEAFDAVAERVELYGSYQELWSELGRRLEPIVPAAGAERDEWVARVFGPLTASMVGAMRPHGLDLTAPGGQATAMDAGQKAAMAGLLRSMARGFRAGGGAGGLAGGGPESFERGGRVR